MDEQPPRPRPFLGRGQELTALRRALGQARSGSFAAVFLCGDAGIGKTRLVREFLTQPDTQDLRVLTGSCVEFGSAGLPFGPFVELLRQVLQAGGGAGVPPELGAALGALVPGLTLAPADTSWPPDSLGRARLFGLALTLLGELAAAGPLVVVLEDVHWADETSLDLLRFLLASLREQQVLLLATYRGEALHRQHPLSRLLADAARHASVEIVEVPPLAEAEVQAMVAADVADPFQVARILERAQGNPFFAEALVTAVHSPRRAEEHLPRRLRDLLLARLDTLPEDVRQLVRVAAVVGRPVPDEVLAAVCGWPPDRLLGALRVAVERQVLAVVDPDKFAVRHALLQHAVYEDLLSAERRAMHGAVAAALRDRLAGTAAADVTVAAELAHHWHESGHVEEAFSAGLRAARMSAAAYAFAEADAEYGRVLSLLPVLPSPPADSPPLALLLEAAEAARRAGQADRALDRVEEAIRSLPATAGDSDRAGVLERLAQCQWDVGKSDAARASYEQAARLAGGDVDGGLRARVLAAHARVLMALHEFAASEELCRQASRTAASSGATGAATSALITSGVNRAMTGQLEDGLAALRAACLSAGQSSRLDDLVRAYGNLAAVLSRAGRAADSVDAAFDGLERLADRGLPLTVGGLLVVNAVAPLVWLGQWARAAQLTEEALTAGVPALHAAFLHQALVEVATGQGDFDRAERHVAAVRSLALESAEAQFIPSFSAAVAELRVWQGDHSRARAAVAEGLDGTSRHQEDLAILLRAVGLRAEADEVERRRWRKIDPGDVPAAADRLLRGAERDLAALRERGAPREAAESALAQCRAEYRRLRGQDDPQLWREVAQGWSSLQRLPVAAYARYREAEAWLGRAEMDRARAALSTAREMCGELAAVPLMREIDALTHRARLAPMPRAPAPTPVSDDAAGLLTEREREVVRLLVNGATNREIGRALFISEKTAGVHVSHILGKLQARNRVEAAAAALRLGLAEAPVP